MGPRRTEVLAMVDTNRRTIRSRAVGRVLSGQDRYEKEALEGDPASPLAAMKRERAAADLLPPSGKGSFSARLQQKAGEDKPRKPLRADGPRCPAPRAGMPGAARPRSWALSLVIAAALGLLWPSPP